MRAILLAAAVLTATPALAQSSVNAFGIDYPVAKLQCVEAPLFKQDFDAIRANPLVQEAAADRRKFCAFFGKAQDGPWRRYAVVQFGDDPYWCGSAGCQVVVFLEDSKGQWRPAMDGNMSNNGFAKEEGGVTIDFSEARDGLPGIGIPMYRSNNELDMVLWVYDPKSGEYTWKTPPMSD